MGFTIDDKKLKRAGLDYWHLLDITHYNDVSEFFCAATDGVLAGDSGAPDKSAFNFYFFETRLGRVYTEPKYEDNVYLFFGSETVGIDKNLLDKNPNQCVHIPMLENSRSMNLSSTVAIGVFEVLRQWNFPDLLSQHQNSQFV
jgi:tRNA (cytidine/uridine-2'-O-)-methyltransferase